MIAMTSFKKLPSHWASYLINGDSTGLSDSEKAQCDSVANKDAFGPCVGISDDHEFGTHQGIGQDLCEYTFLTERS